MCAHTQGVGWKAWYNMEAYKTSVRDYGGRKKMNESIRGMVS